MKKKSFLNGLYAKGALALTIVAGFTLAGCEKEDFNVNVPDINITVPEVDLGEGVFVVTLSATSASGNTLEGVTFIDASGNVLNKTIEYKTAADITVTAKKDGYNTVVKTVNIPAPVKGAYNIIPVSFVLSAVEDPVQIPEQGNPVEGKDPVKGEETKTYADEFKANTPYTLDVEVPFGEFYTAEQKTKLLKAVEELTSPTTRAGEDEEAKANLLIAKKNLRATIDALPTSAKKELRPVTFTLTEAAKSVTFSIQTTSKVCSVKFSTKVAGETYEVEGEQLVVANNEIKATAEGVEISHGHGHGHGDDANAGGGIGNK